MARHRLLACEVLAREFAHAVSVSPNRIDLEFVDQGLHNLGNPAMVQRLQSIVDAVPDRSYDAILLGYGLCNNGLAGLRAGDVPLVLPRAHDCITMLLGSKERYIEEFHREPGTYWLSSGWLERTRGQDGELDSQFATMGEEHRYAEFVEQFGEEDAQYLMETLGGWTQHYTRMAYVALGLGPEEAFRQWAQQEADKSSLRYDEIPGDMQLCQRLVDGPAWDEEAFLVVPPGEAIEPSHNDGIVRCAKCKGGATTV